MEPIGKLIGELVGSEVLGDSDGDMAGSEMVGNADGDVGTHGIVLGSVVPQSAR